MTTLLVRTSFYACLYPLAQTKIRYVCEAHITRVHYTPSHDSAILLSESLKWLHLTLDGCSIDSALPPNVSVVLSSPVPFLFMLPVIQMQCARRLLYSYGATLVKDDSKRIIILRLNCCTGGAR